MITPLKDGSRSARERIAHLLDRGAIGGKVEADVRRIIDDVRRGGDKALTRLSKRFDGVEIRAGRFELPIDKVRQGAERSAPATRSALRKAHSRIRRFHMLQRTRGFEQREAGISTGMRVAPLDRVGVYVPGGTAAYPSTVLMNVVPAKVAGVREIVLVTPPAKDGIPTAVLTAAELAGVDRVFTIGGAQAIAALAYGTATIPQVDKIVGPGNAYVATAKRLLFGQVGIDTVAGPSEVLVVADGGARAPLIAADMLAQAEHDAMAAAICITTSKRLADAVAASLSLQLESLTRRTIAARSLQRYGTIIVTKTLDRALELADELAPEHLELFVARPRRALAKVRNAGAVFLGEATTESLGDYAAGPNHVLPTGRAARFSSPLGVYDFVKRTSIIEASQAGLEALAPVVLELARYEGLEAHEKAVRARLKRKAR